MIEKIKPSENFAQFFFEILKITPTLIIEQQKTRPDLQTPELNLIIEGFITLMDKLNKELPKYNYLFEMLNIFFIPDKKQMVNALINFILFNYSKILGSDNEISEEVIKFTTKMSLVQGIAFLLDIDTKPDDTNAIEAIDGLGLCIKEQSKILSTTSSIENYYLYIMSLYCRAIIFEKNFNMYAEAFSDYQEIIEILPFYRKYLQRAKDLTSEEVVFSRVLNGLMISSELEKKLYTLKGLLASRDKIENIIPKTSNSALSPTSSVRLNIREQEEGKFTGNQVLSQSVFENDETLQSIQEQIDNNENLKLFYYNIRLEIIDLFSKLSSKIPFDLTDSTLRNIDKAFKRLGALAGPAITAPTNMGAPLIGEGLKQIGDIPGHFDRKQQQNIAANMLIKSAGTGKEPSKLASMIAAYLTWRYQSQIRILSGLQDYKIYKEFYSRKSRFSNKIKFILSKERHHPSAAIAAKYVALKLRKALVKENSSNSYSLALLIDLITKSILETKSSKKFEIVTNVQSNSKIWTIPKMFYCPIIVIPGETFTYIYKKALNEYHEESKEEFYGIQFLTREEVEFELLRGNIIPFSCDNSYTLPKDYISHELEPRKHSMQYRIGEIENELKSMNNKLDIIIRYLQAPTSINNHTNVQHQQSNSQIFNLTDGRQIKIRKLKKADGDGNCGFRSILGDDYLHKDPNLLSRKGIIQILKAELKDQTVNELVSRDLLAKYNEWVSGIWEMEKDNLFPLSINIYFKTMRKQMKAGISNEALTNRIKYYCMSQTAILCYLDNYLIHDKIFPHMQGALLAFAKILGIKVHCFQEQADGSIKLLTDLEYSLKHINGEAFLIQNSIGNHFDCLEVEIISTTPKLNFGDHPGIMFSSKNISTASIEPIDTNLSDTTTEGPSQLVRK
jgi:hypothetical protein